MAKPPAETSTPRRPNLEPGLILKPTKHEASHVLLVVDRDGVPWFIDLFGERCWVAEEDGFDD